MALGEALMPAYKGSLGYDEASLGRFEAWLGKMGEETAKTLFWGARLMQRRIGGIRLPRQSGGWKPLLHRYLKGISAANAFERQAFKMLSVPLKICHYDSKAAYEAAGLVYPYNLSPEEARRQHKMDGVIDEIEELRALEEVELDAVVVGSGAGGAVIAHALASAGWSVLVVEEGAYIHRRALTMSSTEASLRLYRNKGMSFTLGTPPIYLPTGRSVGGTTTVNSGTCYRPPERVLESWQRMGLVGWGMEDLRPHFEAVEAVLEVGRAQKPYLGRAGEAIAQGSERMGYQHNPLLRNAPACDGQGRCAFGCPTEAKRSANISYIPLALRCGAYLAPQTRFEGVISEPISEGFASYEAVRKIRLYHHPSKRHLTLPCRHLILAAGSLNTPLLLKAAGIKNRWLGRNLSIHPAASVIAEFEESGSPQAIPQGYAVESFHEQGLLFEGGTVPLEILGGASFLWGEALQAQMAAYPRLVNFGFMMEDKGKGRLFGQRGEMPIIHYSLSPKDVKKLHRGLEILTGIYLAAGAKRVWPQLQGEYEIRDFRALRAFAAQPLEASRLELSAYHPLGTARMGVSPHDGVVDSKGRVFGWRGLYVADGSLLPSSPAVNPQITIMAAASYLAAMLCQERV
jgi:choline dehydrogenase-like flavoprotein